MEIDTKIVIIVLVIMCIGLIVLCRNDDDDNLSL
jgi:hypothetical protein